MRLRSLSCPVTCTAVLPIGESTVAFVSGLLSGERARRGTRRGRRALGCYRQAILVLRWFLDGTRVAQLALDSQVSGSTAYRYLHEGIARAIPPRDRDTAGMKRAAVPTQ